MKTAGIICECNPIHGGHEYLIREAKKNADAVICVMSGAFVQRGEAAIADPYLRAEALLPAGADAVVELPFPWSASSAEFFAEAGVDILERLGTNELWFGSECGSLTQLMRAAEVCESEEFQKRYAESSMGENGTAAAYFEILGEMCGAEAPAPNDILGISYLRAIRKRERRLVPVTVKRTGSGYREADIGEGGFPSATALRILWREKGVEAVLPHLPAACRAIYEGADKAYDLRHAERLILGLLRLTPADRFNQIAELSGGLGNRLANAAETAETLDELIEKSATKKYPTARLQRGLLYALTEIGQHELRTHAAYVRLLAANKTGCHALAERPSDGIPIVTRKADLPNTIEALRQADTEHRAWALYALCQPSRTTLPSPWSRAPRIFE